MKKLFILLSISTIAFCAPASYEVCAGCHGANGELKALDVSEAIKGWSVDKTTKALKGYKDGSYGKAQKDVMKEYVAKLTDAEIKELAEYISKQ